MNNFLSLQYILIFLAAAVVCVPISKKLGFGSVLGYLIAGLAIGPFGFKLITNVEDIMHISEFGVVLLLFLIGLELQPKKLWQMRLSIFGLGGLQIFINTAIITAIAMLFGMQWNSALLVGMGCSLSSTAIAIQLMSERKILNSTAGQAGFAILLFQDIAVIAMISVLPLLSFSESVQNSGSPFQTIIKFIAVFVAVILTGRYLLSYVIRWIASLHLREIFTGFTLLLIIGMAMLMQFLEVSMALGAFMAGVLLADSEYRHALETDIEPFKGLLLGLFFMAVGMSINIDSLIKEPAIILSLVTALFAIKITVHFLLGKLFKLPKSQLFFFALSIAQVGEFAFVLFGSAKQLGIFTDQLSEKLIAVVAISMLLTPLLIKLYDKFYLPLTQRKKNTDADVIGGEASPIIIAGFGRFGQIVGRLLYANGISATVLDYEPDQIELLRKFGFKVYYGDATRLDLLEAAGAAKAKILVVAVDDADNSLKIIDIAQEAFPQLKIYTRARNVQHMYSLMDRKVEAIERETFDSSLRLGSSILQGMGWPAYQAVLAANKFRVHNLEVINELHPIRNDLQNSISKAKQSREDLEKMFTEDAEIREQRNMAWDN
jgi:glutathione-regulated potassium-efflux system ancillary protein KefC